MACKILKLGVFFDGTGNSKIPDSSKGQMSNIAKLSELYKEGSFEENGKDVTSKMLYVNGVGTYDSEMATIFNWIDRKYDKGGGGGGAKRINEMIDKVTTELDAHPYSLKKSGFIKREINLFGFSRGAAMARDFVNTFKEYKINDADGDYKDVRFNFIGIYDTVGSFGTPGNDVDMKPKKEYIQYVEEDYLPNGMTSDADKDFGVEDPKEGREFSTSLGQARGDRELDELVRHYEELGWKVSFRAIGRGNPYTIYQLRGTRDEMDLFEPYNFNLSNKSANTVVHMTANDEVRKNFPLTNVKGAGAKEYAYLGVHSDVGGGYPPESVEEFIYSKQIRAYSKQHAEHYAESFVKDLNAKIQDSLDEYTWYIEDLDLIRTPDRSYGSLKQYKLTLNKKVNNELALVTLQLMYEEAEFHKVPLKEYDETLPSYLQSYFEFAKSNKTSAYEYENTKEGESIQDALAHNSARDPAEADSHKTPDVSPYNGLVHDEPESGNDARYIHKLSGEVVDGRSPNALYLPLRAEREVFDNNPEKAIVDVS